MFAEKILQNEFDQSNSKTSSLWAEDGVDSRLVCVPFSYWYTYIRRQSDGQRANASKGQLFYPLRWLIYVFNSIVTTKLLYSPVDAAPQFL